MVIDIALRNYRCFGDNPARFSVGEGLTALVGPNNAGKSSALRIFYELRELFRVASSSMGALVAPLAGNPQGFGYPSGTVRDLPELFHNQNTRDLEIHVQIQPRSYPVENGGESPLLVLRVPRNTNTFVAAITQSGVPLRLEDGRLFRDARGVGPIAPYVTVLSQLGNTLYLGPFRNIVNLGGSGNYYDATIGQPFVRTWRGLKTGSEKNKNEAVVQLTQRIANVFGISSLQIDASEDETTLQVFIDGKSFKLPEVGSGLTHFIIALTNAAVRTPKPAFILIDEPELNLHPALQRRFLEELADLATSGIIFSTHSIGLARSVAGNVFAVCRGEANASQVRALTEQARLAEFLGEMSFAAHRELGYEKLLLVEGVNDVRTAMELLKLHGKSQKFVVVPLGGSALINEGRGLELEEVRRVAGSGNVAAVIDSEKATETAPVSPERVAFREACKCLSIDCLILERRALENYLADAAVKRVLGPAYRGLSGFEKPEDASPSWAKRDGWRIARGMTIEDLRGTDLGGFLDRL